MDNHGNAHIRIYLIGGENESIFEIDSARLFTPFMDEESVSSDSESKEEDQAEAVKSAPKVPDKCQEPQKKKQPIQKDKRQQPKNIRNPKSKQTAIWVPKKVLQAQKGKNHIWLPKTTRPQPTIVSTTNGLRKKETKKRGSNTKEYVLKCTSQVIQRWVPKKSLQAQDYYKGAAKS